MKIATKSLTRGSNWFLCFAVVGLLFTFWSPTQAQNPTKVPRIGYLVVPPIVLANQARIEAFRQGLRALGYIEGKNIIVEWRSAEGKFDRLAALAADLVRLNVDVIVTAGPADTRAAKEATSTIPIIMAQDTDPIGNGFVASLARPDGNITGLSTLAPEISGKQLELLREVAQRILRVAVFGTSTYPGNAQAVTEIKRAAGTFGIKVEYLNVQDLKDIETGFQAAKDRADAILVLPSPALNPGRARIIELSVKNRLPSIYSNREFVEAGGLMSYGVNFSDLFRRAAIYVDKILKGTKPADLPVEQPTKFELVINLKTAKQIGLIIPPNVLARADRVIR